MLLMLSDAVMLDENGWTPRFAHLLDLIDNAFFHVYQDSSSLWSEA